MLACGNTVPSPAPGVCLTPVLASSRCWCVLVNCPGRRSLLLTVSCSVPPSTTTACRACRRTVRMTSWVVCPLTLRRCHACPRATACRVVCNLRAGVVFVPFVLAAAAIDWASRTLAGKSNSFAGKAGGVIGSGGGTGAAKASIHLRDICVFLNVHLLQKPEVCVAPRHVALWQGWGMGGISRSAPGVPPTCACGWWTVGWTAVLFLVERVFVCRSAAAPWWCRCKCDAGTRTTPRRRSTPPAT